MRKFSWVLMILMLVSSPAMAMDPGGYIGLTVYGVSHDLPGNSDDPALFPLNTLGYKFSDYFYAEVTGGDQGGSFSRADTGVDAWSDQVTELRAADLKLVTMIPAGPVSILLTGGVNYWDSNSRTDDKQVNLIDPGTPLDPSDDYLGAQSVGGSSVADSGVDPIYGAGVMFEAGAGSEIRVMYTTTNMAGFTVENYRLTLAIPFNN